MNVLQFGKAQVTTFGDGSGGVRSGVTAKGCRGHAAGIGLVGIEVLAQARQSGFTQFITALLGRGQVTGQGVDRFYRGDAVALAHQPGPGSSAEGVGQQIADEGGHHVQGTTGVSFGHRLEVFGGQWLAIQIHPPGVGHVGDHIHPGAGQSVSGDKHGIELFLVLHPPAGDQLAGQRSDTFASLLAVTYGTISGLPQIVGVGVSAHGWYSLWSLFDVSLCSLGSIAPLGTSSTSSMSGLAQASVLASSLAGRAGARPSQARARSCFPPGSVEHQLDGRPGSSLCAGQQPRWTSWCSSLRVTSGYAIRVIAFRKRSNEPANITAPIRARARKGFQTVSSPAPR